MKRTSRLLLIIGAAFLILAALVTQKQNAGQLGDAPSVKQEVAAALAAQDWNTFKNTGYNYSFTYPQTWDVGGQQLTAITLSPTKTSPPGALLVLVLEDKKLNYIDEYQSLYKKNYSNGTCGVVEDTKLGAGGKKLTCTDTSGAKVTSYFGEYNGRLYQVMYYTAFSYADSLNEVFQKIVDSFAFMESA